MQSALLPLLTFLAVAMGVTAVFSLLSDLFQRDRKRVKERLEVEFHHKQREKVKRSLLFKQGDSFQAEILDNVQAPRLSWGERLQAMLDQSGLELTKTRLLSYCGGVAAGVRY